MFRIMRTNDFETSVFYEAACSCGSKDHNATIEFEIDNRFPDMIFMDFYKDIAWCSRWGEENKFKRFWIRIKAAARILFTGYIEAEETFILSGEEQIKDFIKALQEGYATIRIKMAELKIEEKNTFHQKKEK